MAFVFRSPRNLDNASLDTCNICQPHDLQPSETKKIIPKINKPIKGFTFQTNERVYEKEHDFQLSGDKQIKKIHQRQQNRQNKKSNNQQFFFKSKCDRFKQQIQENEEKIKQFLKAEIVCSKSKQKKNNFSIFQQKKKKKCQQEQIKVSNEKNSNNMKFHSTGKRKLQQKQKGLPCLMSKQWKNSISQMNLLDSKKKAEKIFAIPSIPGKQQKFGYVLKNNELFYPKFTSKPRFQGQKDDLPGPTDYYINNKTKVKHVLKFDKHNYRSNSYQNDFYALVDDQQALKKHNQKIKQWMKQGKQNKRKLKRVKHVLKQKQREDIETRDKSINSNQSGETQYDDDNTPGPGYYNFSCPKQKKNFRSKNEKFSRIFFNKSQRFQQLQKIKSPSYSFCLQVQNNETNNQNVTWNNKQNRFFISKLKRNIKMQNQSQAPSPGHYNVRLSMQNDIIAKILKNSPNLFNNRLPRLIDTVCSITPGPGYYNLNQPNFKVQSFRPQYQKQQQNSSGRKTHELKYQQKILIQNIKQNFNSHKKKDSIIEQKNVPFLSSSPKGLLYKNLCVTNIHTCMPVEGIRNKRNKQNYFPFNSSEQKIKIVSSPYNAGVGLYEVSNTKELEKRSFNVLFN